MNDVLFDYSDSIAVLTLNRPEKLNSLNRSLLGDLAAAAAELEKNPGVRCLVVTGAGDKAFAAGADLKEMRELSPTSAKDFSRFGNDVFQRIEALPFPTIAAVNGCVFGGGLELALCCDLRLSSEDAAFAFPETSLGIIPGFGGTQRLARLVGYSAAAKMIFSAEKIRAPEALSIGLVDEVLGKDQFRERAFLLARTIAGNAPLAVRAAKRVMRQGLAMEIAGGLSLETEAFAEVFGTKDRTEGLTAFFEKREKKFTGS